MITIKASENNWLFNGECFVKVITLATDSDAEMWHEVTEEYKEQWEREHAPIEPEPENEQ